MRKSPTDIILAAYAILSAFFLGINLLTDRSTLWAVWPIWVFGAITAFVIGILRYPGHRVVASWLGAGGILIAGLIVINLVQGGTIWFYWPLAVWLIIAAVLIGLTVDLLSSVPTSRPATQDELDAAGRLTPPSLDRPSSTQLTATEPSSNGNDTVAASNAHPREIV